MQSNVTDKIRISEICFSLVNQNKYNFKCKQSEKELNEKIFKLWVNSNLEQWYKFISIDYLMEDETLMVDNLNPTIKADNFDGLIFV